MPKHLKSDARRYVNTRALCSECLKKQEEICRLREKIHRLEADKRALQQKLQEGYFGASTPSSRKPFKPNSGGTPGEKKNGGAQLGHRGHGRTTVQAHEADVVQILETDTVCPKCGGALKNLGTKDRTVIDIVPVQVQKIVYQRRRRHCPKCDRFFTAQAPGVLPKFKFGNNLLAHAAIEHYLYGIPLQRVAERLGIGAGTLIESLHRLADRFKEVPEKLIASYRQAHRKHADETTWRNDGHNWQAWLFCTPALSIFRLRQTRSASVVKEVLGQRPLPGVLGVDRYAAYNAAPCAKQYCYAHLLRHVKDLGTEFPHRPDVQDFVNTAAPLVAEAMRLRSKAITDEAFYRQAEVLKDEIQYVMRMPAKHPGIQRIQTIFQEHLPRLYQWAKDRSIPADNNLAERDLRQLVIARKISFGSQSGKGAHTREILMTTLVTLRKRCGQEGMPRLKACLDQLAVPGKHDPYQLLFPTNTS